MDQQREPAEGAAAAPADEHSPGGDRQSPGRRHRSFRLKCGLAGLGLVLFLLLVIPIPVMRTMTWMDAVTGSTKHRTDLVLGPFEVEGLIASPTIRPSPLAEWVARKEGSITHDWRHIEGTWRTILGQPRGFGHGRVPAIYPLNADFLEDLVQYGTDEEISRFVHTMRHGSQGEQEAAVMAVIEKSAQGLWKPPGEDLSAQ